MDDHDFFIVLGYLAKPIRQCKLDAEMPTKEQSKFTSRYMRLTGITPQPDNRNYYILHEGADKWGLELRLYFIAENSSVPPILRSMVVTPRPATIYNKRINDNNLIWHLIEYGLLLGDTQDESRIRGRVPSEYIDDFNIGYQII
ncbi:MAG: hypothetical protein ABII09_11805 [Planctomycetota bacterium]